MNSHILKHLIDCLKEGCKIQHVSSESPVIAIFKNTTGNVAQLEDGTLINLDDCIGVEFTIWACSFCLTFPMC